MAYSVVQTTENNKPYLSVVPNKWIVENGWVKFVDGCADGIAAKADGIDSLYWPPDKVNDLLRQPDSVPQPSWKIMKCKIKRRDLEWHVANKIQGDMMEKSETEEECHAEVRKKRRIDKMRSSVLLDSKFKSQLKAINGSSKSTNITKTKRKLIRKLQGKPYFNKTSIKVQNQSKNGANSDFELPPPNISTNDISFIQDNTNNADTNSTMVLQKILETVNTLKDTMETRMSALELKVNIIENQIEKLPFLMKEAAKPLLEESAKIQMVIEQLYSTKDDSLFNRVSNVQLEMPTDIAGFDVIDSLSKLEQLEQNLADSNFFTNLFNKLICYNRQCSGSGQTVCYNLLDRIFTRPFLTECSWTGLGRQTAKHRFDNKYRTIKLFCDVVLAADSAFSVSQCEEFLKKQLRNSTARLKSKQLRRSAQRSRGSKNRTTLIIDETSSDFGDAINQ